MRLETLMAAVVVMSQISAPAMAELRDSSSSPQFSASETRTIGRNKLLGALIETDPWLVREILDTVAKRTAKNCDEFIARALDGIDRARNPDIVSATRTAAASIEWIELLRRARAEKEAYQKKAKDEAAGRSAEGSVQFLEMLKKAKKEKGAAR